MTDAADARVEVVDAGRGGGINYHEGGDQVISFDWEFAMEPALALIWGPKAATWDAEFPWAVGRQQQIYQMVGREVVRQRAPGGAYEFDLSAGEMTILAHASRNSSARSAAYQQFLEKMPVPWQSEEERARYDLALLPAMREEELAEVVTIVAALEVGWREVELFEAIGSSAAWAAVEEATRHHLSADTRLAAAAALHRTGRFPEIEAFIAVQLRRLSDTRKGLERALALAAEHPGPVVQQGLLWSSYNATDCAPRCAALLLGLSGAAREPFDNGVTAMLTNLGKHTSAFRRDEAFAELQKRVGFELKRDVEY